MHEDQCPWEWGMCPAPGVCAGRPPAHRLVRADGVHLGSEHHRRENEEEQPLEAQQDEKDHRGGRREVAALCKQRARGSRLAHAHHPQAPLPQVPRWVLLVPRLWSPDLSEDPPHPTWLHLHSLWEPSLTGRALPGPPSHTPALARCRFPPAGHPLRPRPGLQALSAVSTWPPSLCFSSPRAEQLPPCRPGSGRNKALLPAALRKRAVSSVPKTETRPH